MRNEIKMFFYIILLILGKSNAFTVDDYNGAVESYKSNDKYLVSLNYLKQHTSTIEITFYDDQKKFINGFVNENSFFVLNQLLLSGRLIELKPMKLINYIYDHKKITMDEISLLRRIKYSAILSIKGDTANMKNLNEFSDFFYNRGQIQNSIFHKFEIDGNIDSVNRKFLDEHWGMWKDYFNSTKIESSTKIKLYLTPMIKDLRWFIIGKPNDKTVDEVIPLDYINENLLFISSKIEHTSEPNFLMPVNGLKFTNSDIGAYLVACTPISPIGKPCKFYGQIIKVMQTSQDKQMVVFRYIYSNLISTTEFLYKSRIRPIWDLVDPNREDDAIILPKGSGGNTSLLTGSSSFEIDKIKPKTPTFSHKDEDRVDDDLHSKSKKHKSNSFDKNHLSLHGLTCNQINKLGIHYLPQEVKINVYQITEDSELSMGLNVYNIRGVYLINGEIIKFNGCYESPYGDYLVRSLD